MLFNSQAFALFFPAAVILYYSTAPSRRWACLLAASCYFYMFLVPLNIVVLGTTIIVDYAAAIFIEEHAGTTRRAALLFSVLATCAILAVFKYAAFISSNLDWMLRPGGLAGTAASPLLTRLYRRALPIGLSFHTFQSLSYVIEVYRGKQKAERHFGYYALYVMFFPQLVAGPIERPQNLLHQFHAAREFDFDRLRSGLLTMLSGLFLKAVIADRLSIVVNAFYDDPSSASGLGLLIATVFFAFQIYCDFAGYSLMAVGAAETLGIDLMTNFRRPYLATSVSEFWQRWHISLSTWFRDYVYIPLGGSKVPYSRWQFNLLVTFLISGIWHGANWTYVTWGGLNGLYLIIENAARARFGPPGNLAGRLRTFFLISASWILFRSRSLSVAWTILQKIALLRPGTAALPWTDIACGSALIAGLLAYEAAEENGALIPRLLNLSRPARWAAYYALVLALFLFGVYGSNKFIYFQF